MDKRASEKWRETLNPGSVPAAPTANDDNPDISNLEGTGFQIWLDKSGRDRINLDYHNIEASVCEGCCKVTIFTVSRMFRAVIIEGQNLEFLLDLLQSRRMRRIRPENRPPAEMIAKTETIPFFIESVVVEGRASGDDDQEEDED